MPSLSNINRSAFALALLTTVGVLVHDTKIDYATATALAIPAVLMSLDSSKALNLGGTDHTHVERVSFSRAVNILNSGNNRTAPRSDKKFLPAKKVAKGAQGFDGYFLPEDGLA